MEELLIAGLSGFFNFLGASNASTTSSNNTAKEVQLSKDALQNRNQALKSAYDYLNNQGTDYLNKLYASQKLSSKLTDTVSNPNSGYAQLIKYANIDNVNSELSKGIATQSNLISQQLASQGLLKSGALIQAQAKLASDSTNAGLTLAAASAKAAADVETQATQLGIIANTQAAGAEFGRQATMADILGRGAGAPAIPGAYDEAPQQPLKQPKVPLFLNLFG